MTQPPATATWKAIRDDLVGFVNQRVESRETAEDIVQDVLERLQRAPAGSITNPQAWLYRAARNATIDHYRTRRTSEPVDAITEPVDDPYRDDTRPNAAIRELVGCLRPLMTQLPDIYHRALLMVDIDGATHEHAARIENVSTSGMKSRVQRGRSKLAELLTACCAITTDSAGSISDYQPSTGCDCH